LKFHKIAVVVIEEEVVREDLTAVASANLMAVAAVAANADHMVAANANRMAAAAVAANADLMVVAKAEIQIVEAVKAEDILQKEDRRVLEAQAVRILQAELLEENAKTKIQEAADGNPFALIIKEQV
jgi:poly-gamma-glutamate capsule biosynthesis protein CapA/YwtB (metallophosphatase superfamily)